ncbi:MAG: NAD(P)(+) transhydrogenase (Re/Si-specific) subunit alpha, partial [Alphaproteobacteria bacterium]
MQLGIPRETAKGEQRVAMTPEVTAKLAKLGHDLIIEPGAGKAAGFADAAYVEAGATLAKS